MTLNATGSVSYLHNVSYQICNKIIRSYNELGFLLVDEFDKLVKHRTNLIQELSVFHDKNQTKSETSVGGITSKMVKQAADCHLRPGQQGKYPKIKCNLCKSDKALREYAKHLFEHSEDVITQVSRKNVTEYKRSSEDEDEELEKNDAYAYHTQLRTRSDLEKLMRLVNNFIKKAAIKMSLFLLVEVIFLNYYFKFFLFIYF